MLHAADNGFIAVIIKPMYHVSLRMLEPEAPVYQTEHPAFMGILTGQQGGTARGACGRGTKSLPEKHPIRGETLQLRRVHGMAVRRDVSARVV